MKLFWGCREVGDAVNKIYCVATHFHLKDIIVNFGGAEEVLEVQRETPKRKEH